MILAPDDVRLILVSISSDHFFRRGGATSRRGERRGNEPEEAQ